MKISSKIGMSGRVKLTISGGARGCIDLPWQKNMILDQGFRYILTQSESLENPLIMRYISVGSSSDSVTPTDTGLGAPIAVSPSNLTTPTSGWDADGGYGWSRRVTSFPRGAAAGNLSELTMGWGNNNSSAFARALILDNLGNPTTITVLSDEVLTVTWELQRFFTPPEDRYLKYMDDGVEKETFVSFPKLSDYSTGAGGLGSGGYLPVYSTDPIAGGSLIGDFKATLRYRFTESQGNPQVGSIPTVNATGTSGRLIPYTTQLISFNPPISKSTEFILDFYYITELSRRGE